MGIARNVLLWASTNKTLAQRLPRMKFVRRAVRKFMPGETLEDALVEARRLHAGGLPSILTHLGENVDDAGEAESVRDHYLGVLETLADEEIDAQISVKLTQLGLDVDEKLCLDNLIALVERAAAQDNFVWIDMESSRYVDVTLEMHRRVRAEHDNVGVCVQAYLYRTPDDLDELIAMNAAVRLVKGAYNEPADVAHPDKSDVDAAFGKLSDKLLEAVGPDGAFGAFATHDEILVQRVLRNSREKQIPSEHFEIQMLYGIQVSNQKKWTVSGHTVRILISYGEAWYPWYVRRLAERPANVWFVLRNLFKG